MISIHLKTENSMALPLYQQLPDHPLKEELQEHHKFDLDKPLINSKPLTDSYFDLKRQLFLSQNELNALKSRDELQKQTFISIE